MTKQEQSFKMAWRLKSLREESKLSHDKLKTALLQQFGITISRDSLMSYEIQTEPHSKIKNGKYPNLNMGVEYLNAFAQFYGVSADYLLGLSNYPTINAHAAGAAEYTGLSLEAINRIVLETTPHPGFTIYENNMDLISVLNLLLTATHFWGLVNQLRGYINSPKRKTSRAAEISREFHEVNHGANTDDEFNQRDIFGYRAVREFNSLLEELDKNEREAKDDGKH